MPLAESCVLFRMRTPLPAAVANDALSWAAASAGPLLVQEVVIDAAAIKR